MSPLRRIKHRVTRRFGAPRYFYAVNRVDGKGTDYLMRWENLLSVADFRAEDRVLDIGCAEGLITLEVAKLVRHVYGVEPMPERVTFARRHAKELGIENAEFEVGTIDMPFPEDIDVTLLLDVYGKQKADGSKIATADLCRILNNTKRQAFVRVNLEENRPGLTEIIDCCATCGFEYFCFMRPNNTLANMVVCNRIGTDARVPDALPYMILPTGRAIRLLTKEE